jgi:hypothetical protein
MSFSAGFEVEQAKERERITNRLKELWSRVKESYSSPEGLGTGTWGEEKKTMSELRGYDNWKTQEPVDIYNVPPMVDPDHECPYCGARDDDDHDSKCPLFLSPDLQPEH